MADASVEYLRGVDEGHKAVDKLERRIHLLESENTNLRQALEFVRRGSRVEADKLLDLANERRFQRRRI